MEIRRLRAFGTAATLLAGLAAGCRTVPTFDSRQRGELAKAVISGWVESSRLTAAKAIEQYGPPDAIAQGALGWKRKGPWKRIVAWNASADYDVKELTASDLEQTVAYSVPDAKREALAYFNHGVRVPQNGSELSARSGDERLNYLALNLADEIARGARNPEAACRFYERTVELAASGKSSPYMTGLRFKTQDQDR